MKWRDEEEAMSDDFAAHYLDDARAQFRGLKKLGDGALAQLSDEELFVALDPESNSVAIIIKHLHGNMRSRWTDFLNSDGEKPDRDRDREFILDRPATGGEVRQWWEEGWQTVFDALEPLTSADINRQVLIRREPHTIVQAINRQLTHYGAHVGQIVFLAKHLKSTAWRSLSIPRGQSVEFNRRLMK
jgi:hypothetical protein